MSDIIYFWKHTEKPFGYLCNWYDAPITYNNVHFKTSEHLYMYLKAMLFGAEDIAEKIEKCLHPWQAKALGRKVKITDWKMWERERFGIMKTAVREKFTQNKELRDMLLETGDKMFAEASPCDNIWGIAMSADIAKEASPSEWRGLNLLGEILKDVRDELRMEKDRPKKRVKTE